MYGTLPRPAIKKMRVDYKSFVDLNTKSLEFFVTDISLVLHLHNSMTSTFHLNYRYFKTLNPKDPVNVTCHVTQNWWFGDGTDLTPIYLFKEDVQHFYKTIKTIYNKYDKNNYLKFKK